MSVGCSLCDPRFFVRGLRVCLVCSLLVVCCVLYIGRCVLTCVVCLCFALCVVCCLLRVGCGALLVVLCAVS